MSKKMPVIVSIISLCVSITCLVLFFALSKPQQNAKPQGTKLQDTQLADQGLTTQYVMYVGTNDKDTYAPKYSQEEAKKIVDDICLKHFEGYTLQEATGSWVDETGTKTHEYTIVCYFDGADEKTVHEAADEIIKALNQNTLLIESTSLKAEYYSGK